MPRVSLMRRAHDAFGESSPAGVCVGGGGNDVVWGGSDGACFLLPVFVFVLYSFYFLLFLLVLIHVLIPFISLPTKERY